MNRFKSYPTKLKFKTNKIVTKNIFDMLGVLKEVGVPFSESPTKYRSRERLAKVCLAIGSIRKSLRDAKSVKDGTYLTTREIQAYMNKYLCDSLADSSYDGIKRDEIDLLMIANIAQCSADKESQATNDGRRGYCMSDDFAELLQSVRTPQWDSALTVFKEKTRQAMDELERKREAERIPVTLPSGESLLLSYGEHNEIQKAIVESFLPIFANRNKDCEVLYIGDTTQKQLYKNEDRLNKLGFFDLNHQELPDIVAYSESQNLLFLIEAVHCKGHWDKTRMYAVKKKLVNCKANIVYVTAFEKIEDFRSKAADIAWDTEVWIANIPNHMIHFNGWKFLEIHK